MGLPIARIGDRTQGTCYAHPVPISTGGTIISGSQITQDQNLPIARLDDAVLTDCGHTDYINSASGTVDGEFKRIARLTDTVGRDGVYKATIISASPVTYADD
jgi:uncharacterized Zn-binding protein involved in type VI secretion